MKIFIHIFALYFCCLSFLPCGDAKNFQPVQLSENNTISAESTEDNEHKDCGGNCSMMCSCACCGSPLSEPPTIEKIFDESIILTHQNPIKITHFHPFSIISTIWQPPKQS